MGQGTNSTVYSLTTYNGILYLGGNFTIAGGVPAHYIASWNGSDFNSLNAEVDGRVSVLAAYNCELYAVGSFDIAGGVPVKDIAKWNGTGWSSLGSGVTQVFHVNALCVYNSDLYVGSSTPSVPQNNILKWNIPIPPPPNASFSASDSTIQPDTYIQFINTSTTGTTIQWSFQGGIPSSSIAPNPIIYYPNIGIYDVTLIAANCIGTDTLVKNAYINVDTNLSSIIPYGISLDFLEINTPPNTIIYEGTYHITYYKPTNYDSLTSPILWYVHGSGGSGAEGPAILTDIAERRNALIISPTMQNGTLGWAYVSNGYIDTITGYSYVLWSTQIFKDIYRHVLQRENRNSIPVYLTGFSQGAQFVTRYMLVRQFDPDTIPIQMAVSVNPANYTLCTDTFNGIEMDWTAYRCGLAGQSPVCSYSTWNYISVSLLICNSHVIQYYNENYGVLIGTLDTATFQGFCPGQGGDNRYERAIAFYNFSDTNAIARGTTLRWQYGEVPGVGHDGYAMYNTILTGDSISVAERLLFKTPYHNVPQLAPHAFFTADTTFVSLPNATVWFQNNSILATSYLWDFGDSTISTGTNPTHTYLYADTFTVSLTTSNEADCGNKIIKQDYIIVAPLSNIYEFNGKQMYLSVYPNPFTETTTINFMLKEMNAVKLEIYNCMGQLIEVLYNDNAIENKNYKINFIPKNKGIYYAILQTSRKNNVIKIVKI